MEMVYIINGNESGGGGGGGGSSGGGAAAGYPIVKAVVTDGAVGLQDRSVTRVELKTSDPVRINFPPKTEGVARDFILRLVITADSIPEVTFAVPTGETFSFEESEDNTFSCAVGVNIFAFTETDDGLFIVNRKVVSIAQTVVFDANGGTVETPAKDYILGAKYGSLPVPARTGYTFLRWLTGDGVEVEATDTAKTSVPRLVGAGCAASILPESFAVRVLFVLVCLCVTVLQALWGMTMGLMKPDLEWTNEVTPVKQNIYVAFSLFGMWLYAMLLFAPYLLVSRMVGPAVYLAASGGLTVLLSALLYRRLKTKGVEQFESL